MIDGSGQVRRLLAAVMAVGLGVTGFVAIAPAAPLDEQTCQQLKRDAADLEGIGARANLGKGAAWGRTNLNSTQLEQVKKLIEIDEAIAFRCPRPKPVPEVVPGAAPVAGKAKAKALGKAPQKAQPGAKAAKGDPATAAKPRPKPKAAADAGTGQPAPQAVSKPKPRPAPLAPKPQDAYVAPGKAQ